MVKKNMTVEVSFPGIEKKSAPVRSLANFIAENSSLYFRKNNDGSGSITINDEFYSFNKDGYDRVVLSIVKADGSLVETNSKVFISGDLLLDSDNTVTQHVSAYANVEFSPELDRPGRSVAGIIIQAPEDDSSSWTGFENLSVMQIEAPSTDKSYLEQYAENHSIKLYDFTYTLEPGLDNYPGMYTITLDDNDFEGILYISGYRSYENDISSTIEIVPVVSEQVLFLKDQENPSASACTIMSERLINIESLVISEQPLIEVSTDDKSNISGNIRFDNMIMPYRGNFTSGLYDISALYGKSTAGNKVAAQSEDNEDIRGFKMVAARPGVDGNRLTAVFTRGSRPSRGSGSDLTFTLYKDYDEESQEELFFYYIGVSYCPTADYYDLNDMYDYTNDERHSINEYVKFIYTSPFEYDDMICKWGVFNYYVDGNTYPKVIHFTGGSDSADDVSAGGKLRSSIPTTETDTAVKSDSATGFVIDCETYLCRENSTLAVRKWAFNSDQTCDVSEMDGFFKLPITITPKINGKVNTDKSVTPSDSLFSNITGACAIPLSGKIGKYDIQLRTPTFTLCEYDTESEEFVSDHDVYYKVGVVPSDGLEETRDKIVKFLSGQCIELDYGIPSGSEMFPLSIGLLRADWQDNSYSVLPQSNNMGGEYYENYTMWCSVLDLESYINAPQDYTNLSEWMPKSMCLTLFDNSTSELKGLVYFKLCNSDGTPFDVELQKPYYTCLKQSEDEIVQSYDSHIGMYMTLTDEKLDGGFVRVCNMNFVAHDEPGV